MPNPPKPTALKILNGSAAVNPGRLNRDEPMPDVLNEVPAPPYALVGRARSCWDRLAHEAIALRVLTAADLDMLAITCRAFAEYERARHDEESWRRADAAWKRFATGLAAFGMSPSSRTRVRAVPKVNDDGMADLLKPKRASG